VIPPETPKAPRPEACETPLADLRASALKHYEDLSARACDWLSTVPRAINFYFDAKDREVPSQPQGAPPETPISKPPLPIPDALRSLVEIVALYEAIPNLGYEVRRAELRADANSIVAQITDEFTELESRLASSESDREGLRAILAEVADLAERWAGGDASYLGTVLAVKCMGVDADAAGEAIGDLRKAVAKYHDAWVARDELDCREDGTEAPLELRQRLSREKARAFHHMLVLARVVPPTPEPSRAALGAEEPRK
jgi:hypothetical protein